MAAPLEFSGEEIFRAPPAEVYAAMTDPNLIAQCIPDLVSANVVDGHSLECVVRPGFSFLRGTLKVKIEIAEQEPPHRAVSRVESSGIGQTLRLVSRMEITPEHEGSRLQWRAEVTERKGLVAAISPALIKGAADQVIRQAWGRIRSQLGEG